MIKVNLRLIVMTVLFSILVFACSSTNKIKAPPLEVRANYLSKGVHDYGVSSYAYEKTNVFYTYDSEVCSYLKLRNLSGEHKIRWDWIKPDGGLYYSTGNKTIATQSGFYKSETAIWHKLMIIGDQASEFPGHWEVNIYFDNDIIATNQFELKYAVEIEKMPYYSKAPDQSKWGIVIGIENYSNLPDAVFAKKDAELVSEYFKNILGVPNENLIQIYDNDATKGKIEGLFKSYLPLNTDQDSTLYVFFSGHGLPGLKKGEAFLATHDCDSRFIEHTGYSLNGLYHEIDMLGLKQAYVFIDSCFSGVSLRGKEMLMAGARPALIKVEDINMPSDKIITLNSSRADQISNSYSEKEHGLFTYFLLRGVRGPADENNDAKITLKELYEYVKKNVENISRRNGVLQSPGLNHGNISVENMEFADVLK